MGRMEYFCLFDYNQLLRLIFQYLHRSILNQRLLCVTVWNCHSHNLDSVLYYYTIYNHCPALGFGLSAFNMHAVREITIIRLRLNGLDFKIKFFFTKEYLDFKKSKLY
jgi:hypothetical protein